MTVRHIKYGAKAEDVVSFSTAFIDSIERILAEKWCVLSILKREDLNHLIAVDASRKFESI